MAHFGKTIRQNDVEMSRFSPFDTVVPHLSPSNWVIPAAVDHTL
jgi:hypothetical protein